MTVLSKTSKDDTVMLTAIAIKNAKPKKEPYKISDGQG